MKAAFSEQHFGTTCERADVSCALQAVANKLYPASSQYFGKSHGLLILRFIREKAGWNRGNIWPLNKIPRNRTRARLLGLWPLRVGGKSSAHNKYYPIAVPILGLEGQGRPHREHGLLMRHDHP